MINETYQHELRFKRGSNILRLINRFSATEKVIFAILVVALSLSAFLMVIADSNYFRVSIPASGGELREGLVGLPRTVNPILAITDVDRDISALVYSGLMKYDGEKLVPDLAKSYSVSDDGLVYDFKLKNNIYFQNGSQVTADDVEFTIQKILDPNLKSPRRSDWTNVTVRKISNTEIQFVLKQAYSPFLYNTTVGIVPKSIWGNVSDDQFIFSEYNIEPVGSGPYKVASISRDSGGIPSEFKLSTWNNYYDKKPYISSIVFRFYPDQEKAVAGFMNGDIGSLPALSAIEAAKLKDGQNTLVSTPLPRIFGVFFNQNQAKVLSDKTVRQALDKAVDRDTLVNKVLSGFGVGIQGPLPDTARMRTNAVVASTTASTTDSAAYIRAAEDILEKNGWKKGDDGLYFKKSAKTASSTIDFTIYTSDSPELIETAQYLRDTWNTMGANVDVKTFSSSDLYQNIIRTRKYDALLFGIQLGRDRDLYAFWHSSQRNAPGLNIAMYANSNVDKLLEEIRTTNSDSEKKSDYADLDKEIRNDLPAIFLYSPEFTYLIPNELKGISINSVSQSSDRWYGIGKWYLNTESVWKIFTKNQ